MSINKKSKIFIAGHNGMVGSAILRKFKDLGFKNILIAPKKKLDLINQEKVFSFLKKSKPHIVIIAAAKVGGIFANSNYANSSFVVPDTLKDNRYSIVHMVPASVLDLPEVKVYPWPSREDFARAFLEMDPYDDALRKAQRELSGESLAFAAAKLEGDASLAYGSSINERYTKLYTQGQLPVNNLFNPASWAKFIEDWKAGNLKIE